MNTCLELVGFSTSNKVKNPLVYVIGKNSKNGWVGLALLKFNPSYFPESICNRLPFD